MQRIVLVGGRGQIGWELARTLAPLGELFVIGRKTSPVSIDLTDFDSIRCALRELSPSIIVNAAAYTAVDRAEQAPENQELQLHLGRALVEQGKYAEAKDVLSAVIAKAPDSESSADAKALLESIP